MESAPPGPDTFPGLRHCPGHGRRRGGGRARSSTTASTAATPTAHGLSTSDCASRAGLEHVWLADPDHRQAFPTGTPRPSTSTDRRRGPRSSPPTSSSPAPTPRWTGTSSRARRTSRPGTAPRSSGCTTTCSGRPPGRLDDLDLDVARWDLLLSPNAASTPRLRQALRLRRARSSSRAIPATTCSAHPALAEIRRARARGARHRRGRDDGPLRPDVARRRRAAADRRRAASPSILRPSRPAWGPDRCLLARAHNLVTTGGRRMSELRGCTTSPTSRTCGTCTPPPTCWSPTTPR